MRERHLEAWGAITAALCLVHVGITHAQIANPVYPDDAPLAVETFPRVEAMVRDQNFSQAAKELQTLLDEQPQRVVPMREDADVFLSLRSRIHTELLASAALLERYRAIQGPVADELLAQGRLEEVETSYLLTRAGLEATLRVAQEHLESSRFWAAYRTLAQLESHPDRVGAGARPAAELMALIARYIDDPILRAHAELWASQAGIPIPPPELAEVPEALRTPALSAGGWLPALVLPAPPASPLWSGSVWSVGPGPSDPAPDNADAAANSGSWIVPTVVGDTIYVNDGVSIAARDRFTLRPRWLVRPKPADGFAPEEQRDFTGRAFGPEVYDTTSVTVAGRVVVATTGLVSGSERLGDPRTHAFDASTGRVLWSVDVGRAHPSLDGGIVRGPAVIEGDLAIVQVRRPLQQRLSAFYVAALGLNDGRVRWVRLVASSGVEPGDTGARHMADPPLLDKGVVYVQDIMGVAAAIDAGSGRTLWVHRFPVSEAPRRLPDLSWEWGGIVASEDLVHVLTSTRDVLLSLDPATGRTMASRSTDTLGGASYILRVGPWLVTVGRTRLAIVPCDKVGVGPVNLTPLLDREQLRGRVVVAGEQVLAPVAAGLAMIDPSRPTDEPRVLPLANPGTTLPLEDQWIALSAGELYSHLTFESASRLLGARIAEDPSDPDPAITLVEMSNRAARGDELVKASDAAIAALDRLGPSSTIAGESRRRLFVALREMVEQTMGQEARPRGTAARDARTPLDAPTLEQAIVRLGRIASGHEERAAHAMAQGLHRETIDRPSEAIESYQRVLADAGMARAPWKSQGLVARAEAEATRRIRLVVRRAGLAAYAAFDAEAARQTLPPGAPVATLEALARRYPASPVAVDWWLRAADLSKDRPTQAIVALDQALSLAELLSDVGAWPDPSQDPLGLVAGRLVGQLERSGQPFAAAQLIDRLRSTRPGLAVRDDAGPLALDELSANLAARLADAVRLPQLGAMLQPEVQVLPGWTLMHPISIASRSLEFAVLEHRATGQVALWSVAASQGQKDEAESAGPLHLRQLWSRTFRPGSGPRLLAVNPASVFLAWDSEGQGVSIERIDAITGRSRYTTPALGPLIQEITLGDQQENPPASIFRPSDVQVAIDEQAIVLVERTGRTVVFSSDDGRVLWKLVSPARWVQDIAATSEVVAIAGEQAPDNGVPAPRGVHPIIALHDARTGAVQGTVDSVLGGVRWMRLTRRGQETWLLIGADRGVQALTLSDRGERWTIVKEQGHPAAETLDAWIAGDILYLLDMNRAVWRLPLETGQAPNKRLETFEHLTGDGPILQTPLPESRVAFSTPSGVCVFDGTGKLVGLDGLGSGALLPPLPASERFAAINTLPRGLPDGRAGYEVFMLDSATCLLREEPQVLILPERPQRALLLDGRMIVTAGGSSFVYAAPTTAAAPRP